jgi:hypothetical protein
MLQTGAHLDVNKSSSYSSYITHKNKDINVSHMQKM